MTPSVLGWPHLVNVLWDPVVQSLMTWARCSWNVFCVLCVPCCCNWVYYYWPSHAWHWPWGWLTVRLSPDHGMWAAVPLLTTRSGICLSRVYWQLRSLFEYAAYEAYWILLWCCLQLATGLDYGPLGRDSGADQCQTLPVTGHGQPVLSYKQSPVCGSLCCSWVHRGRTKLCTKADFYQHWAWRQISTSPKAPQDLPLPASTCQLPVRLSHRKSLWLDSNCMRKVLVGSPG